MRNQMINEKQFFVLNYVGEVAVKDDDGNYTGEKQISYTKPIAFKGHISGARGSSQVEMFGTDVTYDKTIVITKTKFDKLKITENSVFFIEKRPSYKDHIPLYDYRVERISDTLNEVAIAITKVREQ